MEPASTSSNEPVNHGGVPEPADHSSRMDTNTNHSMREYSILRGQLLMLMMMMVMMMMMMMMVVVVMMMMMMMMMMMITCNKLYPARYISTARTSNIRGLFNPRAYLKVNTLKSTECNNKSPLRASVPRRHGFVSKGL